MLLSHVLGGSAFVSCCKQGLKLRGVANLLQVLVQLRSVQPSTGKWLAKHSRHSFVNNRNVYQDSFECQSDMIIKKLEEELKGKDGIVALHNQKIKQLEDIKCEIEKTVSSLVIFKRFLTTLMQLEMNPLPRNTLLKLPLC